MSKNVSRVQIIEIITPTAWMIDKVLWRFRSGTELLLGAENDLEAAQPVVTAQVALALINANRAQPSDTIALDEGSLNYEGSLNCDYGEDARETINCATRGR